MGDKIFIPMSVEHSNTKRSNYFFSAKKGVIMALGILPGVIWVPYVASLTEGSFVGFIVGVVSYAIFLVFLARFLIFEEPTWKRIFQRLKENKLSSFRYFWGIDRVDDDGVIHYKYSGEGNLRKGVVLKFIRGSRIGRGKDYEARYKEVHRKMLNRMLRLGLTADIYTALDDREVPYSIRRMYRQIEKIDDELARGIALEHVNNLAYQTKNKKRVEAIYWVLYFNDPWKFKNIKGITGEIKGIADSSGFFKESKVLNKVEVINFIAKYLCVSMLPDIAAVGDSNEGLGEYGDIVRVFDSDGNEEWIEGERLEVGVEKDIEELGDAREVGGYDEVFIDDLEDGGEHENSLAVEGYLPGENDLEGLVIDDLYNDEGPGEVSGKRDDERDLIEEAKRRELLRYIKGRKGFRGRV